MPSPHRSYCPCGHARTTPASSTNANSETNYSGSCRTNFGQCSKEPSLQSTLLKPQSARAWLSTPNMTVCSKPTEAQSLCGRHCSLSTPSSTKFLTNKKVTSTRTHDGVSNGSLNS